MQQEQSQIPRKWFTWIMPMLLSDIKTRISVRVNVRNISSCRPRPHDDQKASPAIYGESSQERGRLFVISSTVYKLVLRGLRVATFRDDLHPTVASGCAEKSPNLTPPPFAGKTRRLDSSDVHTSTHLLGSSSIPRLHEERRCRKSCCKGKGTFEYKLGAIA